VVLVVDDDETRETICSILEAEGYVAVPASSGRLALDHLRAARQPMVVLLDWMMPRMSGLDVLKTIETAATQMAAHEYILMSAALELCRISAKRLPTTLPVKFLAKPFDLGELLEIVAQAAACVRTAA
jgi:CheY-like chemotaxis protein